MRWRYHTLNFSLWPLINIGILKTEWVVSMHYYPFSSSVVGFLWMLLKSTNFSILLFPVWTSVFLCYILISEPMLGCNCCYVLKHKESPCKLFVAKFSLSRCLFVYNWQRLSMNFASGMSYWFFAAFFSFLRNKASVFNYV
jgi:hypothetical protein